MCDFLVVNFPWVVELLRKGVVERWLDSRWILAGSNVAYLPRRRSRFAFRVHLICLSSEMTKPSRSLGQPARLYLSTSALNVLANLSALTLTACRSKLYTQESRPESLPLLKIENTTPVEVFAAPRFMMPRGSKESKSFVTSPTIHVFRMSAVALAHGTLTQLPASTRIAAFASSLK